MQLRILEYDLDYEDIFVIDGIPYVLGFMDDVNAIWGPARHIYLSIRNWNGGSSWPVASCQR